MAPFLAWRVNLWPKIYKFFGNDFRGMCVAHWYRTKDTWLPSQQLWFESRHPAKLQDFGNKYYLAHHGSWKKIALNHLKIAKYHQKLLYIHHNFLFQGPHWVHGAIKTTKTIYSRKPRYPAQFNILQNRWCHRFCQIKTTLWLSSHLFGNLVQFKQQIFII